MIPDQWYALLDSRELTNKPVGVTRMGERLVFWRSGKSIACIRDKCIHRGASLCLGKLQEGELECPFHGLRYEASGKVTLIPANGRTAIVPEQFHTFSYPVREEHGFIWIWYGITKETYPPIPWFKDLDDSFTYGTVPQHWKSHYSRSIENQLDVAHLPFVHYNTIGRGNRKLVNGPYTTLEDDTITVYPDNEVDEGQTPKRIDEFTSPPHSFFVQFIFPNIWQNHIATEYRVMAAFAPVDDENTIVYLRNYRKGSNQPLLKQIVDFIGARGNLLIAGQDRRIVETQEPKRSELRGGERLIPADRPIVLYRQRREQLLNPSKGS